MAQKFKIVAIGPRDAYRDNMLELIGTEVTVPEDLVEGSDGWHFGDVKFVRTGRLHTFFQVQLEPVEDELEPIKSIIMRRDGATSEDFDMMLEGALRDFDEGMDPEEILSSWFGLEPDYVFELLELAAKRI